MSIPELLSPAGSPDALVSAVHAGADLQLPGYEPLGKKQSPQVTEHDAHIDAKRAVHRTAFAGSA